MMNLHHGRQTPIGVVATIATEFDILLLRAWQAIGRPETASSAYC